MRIVTWNVNSIKSRLPRLLALLERENPDIVCLQEVKTTEDAFPRLELSGAGYQALVHGQQPYNGVAILAREDAKVEEIARDFPGNPLPEEARLIAARVNGLSVASLYVINGRAVGDPMYEAKLVFLRSLREWIGSTVAASDPFLIAGDFNVCTDERDLWDPAGWEGHCHFTQPEREEIARWHAWGLTDLFRVHTTEGGVYSWWDYRAGDFHKGKGLRIDLMLATEPLAKRCTEVRIDRNERRPRAGEGAPSDHAPVIATFSDA